MIRMNHSQFGNTVIKFRHNFPTATVPEQELHSGNSLKSLVETILRSIRTTQGSTECILQLDIGDGLPLYEYTGVSSVFPTDNYNKETGRLQALKYALSFAEQDQVLTAADSREILAGYYSR
jgi:hypothetical protein